MVAFSWKTGALLVVGAVGLWAVARMQFWASGGGGANDKANTPAGHRDNARGVAYKWGSHDSTLNCLTNFCVWSDAKKDLVLETPHTPAPPSLAGLPPLPNALRAVTGANFPLRNTNYWRDMNQTAAHPMAKRLRAKTTGTALVIDDRDFPYVWWMLRPMWTCPQQMRIGDPFDGGKWCCGPQLMPAQKCIVYSYGSNLVFDFETEFHAVAPQCEIHTFDPTCIPRPDTEIPKFVSYHHYGLAAISGAAASDDATKPIGGGGYGTPSFLPGIGLVDSMPHTMARLGHDHIDLLKIDIENSEWDVFNQLDDAVLLRVDELLIELHCDTIRWPTIFQFFDRLFALGFRVFNNEPNLTNPSPVRFYFYEYAFVRIAPGTTTAAPYDRASQKPAAAAAPAAGAAATGPIAASRKRDAPVKHRLPQRTATPNEAPTKKA